MVKPAVAAAGHTLAVEAWSIVLNYKAIGHGAEVIRECDEKSRSRPRMEGSRQMLRWDVRASACTHRVLSRAPEKH